MKDAIAFLRSKNVAMNATWGSLQVAGDTGAPPIALGGGLGDEAGNANALASRNPVTNSGKYKPVTYGSSHIQAISFLDGGGIDTRTILTYGQSEDPTSPWSKDQTEMFGKKQWVSFPFTAAQIKADKVTSVTVSAPELAGSRGGPEEQHRGECCEPGKHQERVRVAADEVGQRCADEGADADPTRLGAISRPFRVPYAEGPHRSVIAVAWISV